MLHQSQTVLKPHNLAVSAVRAPLNIRDNELNNTNDTDTPAGGDNVPASDNDMPAGDDDAPTGDNDAPASHNDASANDIQGLVDEGY